MNESFARCRAENALFLEEAPRSPPWHAALNRAPMPRMRMPPLRWIVACLFVGALAASPACGSDEPPPEEKKAGESIECGGLECDPVILPNPYPPIEACCADNGGCGLDGAQFEQYGANFDDPCQARDQPGVLDPACPASTPIETDLGMLTFPGCCTAESRCGYMVDRALGLIDLGLGCVDAQPFLEAGMPEPCGDGAGGGGGQ